MAASAIGSPDRLAALTRSGLADHRSEEPFDRAARLATRVLGVPVSVLSAVGADRQDFKAQIGLGGWAARECGTPLSHSFCRHVVASGAPLRIEDARREPLFASNPAVEELNIVAYMGVPVRDRDGHVLGSFCAISDAPRAWTDDDLANLTDIAAGIESEIALRALAQAEKNQRETFRAVLDELPVGVVVAEVPGGRLALANQNAGAILGDDLQIGEVAEYARLGARHADGRRYRAGDYPLVRSAVAGEAIENEAMHYRRESGEVRQLHVSSRRIATHPPLAVASFVDVTEKLAAAEALAQRDRRLSRFHQTTGEGIIEIGADDRILSLNGRVREDLARLRGICDADPLIGDPIQSLEIEVTQGLGRPLSLARCSGEMQCYRHETAEGRHLDVRVVPDTDGSVLMVLRDVTEERRLAEGQQLLTQELNHRVKNLFAIVSGMVGMTARASATPAEMGRSLRDRIQALSRAHDMIRPVAGADPDASSGDVSVSALASTILSPHLTFESDTVMFEGPSVMLAASAATNMALLFHEMATNAAKHGALSVPDGVLRVTWAVDGPILVIDWVERGAPARPVPERAGFGTTLIGMVAESQLRGEVTRDWLEGGLHCRFRLPLAIVGGRSR